MITKAPEVHAFQSGEAGLFANAYLVETANHLVAVDSTLLESTSKALRQKVVELGKPLHAVLITHGHPDHYNGVTNLVNGETVDVIATEGVDLVIRKYDAAKEEQWAGMFGAEWPRKRTFPTMVVSDGESIRVDGVTFTVHSLGPGESHSDSYWIVEGGDRKVAFIGDAVLNQVHAYLSDGHITQWLKNLDRLGTELEGVERIYPGHGDSGGLEMIDWERGYLEEYRQTVATLAHGDTRLTDDQKAELTAHMDAFLPGKRLEFMIGLGADPIAAELAAELASAR
jgi:glyoxylase-like metal-dependent hydrolase (beta-lactamase superfamily II)